MIQSATQVLLADGRQRLTFKCTTTPLTALIEWKKGSKTVEVHYDEDSSSYTVTTLIPSEDFTVKLSSEARVLRYEGEWGEATPKEYKELQTRDSVLGYTLLVPYCDLSALTVSLRTITEVPLESWSGLSKKTWRRNGAEVRLAYGAETLIVEVLIPFNTLVKRADSDNWVRLDQLPGGFIVELQGHSRVTTDRVVNATICRDELYGVKWRKEVTV